MKVVCVRGGFRFTSGKIYDADFFPVHFRQTGMAKSGTPVCLFDDEGKICLYDLEKIDFLITLEKWRENQLDKLDI
jgi:hypothetical protein